MTGFTFICLRCGGEAVASEQPARGNICFRCHIQTVNIGFRYGKENFHGPTIKERQNKIVADAKAAGVNAVPAKDYGF